MTAAEKFKVLMALVDQAGGFDNLPADAREFFHAEGKRLLKEMLEQA